MLDPSERAATFVKYQNVNYINACEPRDMQPNIVRRSLIGAIRFGKAFVVDMMNNDMYDVLSDTLAQIRPRLMDMLLDKSILEEEKYVIPRYFAISELYPAAVVCIVSSLAAT